MKREQTKDFNDEQLINGILQGYWEDPDHPERVVMVNKGIQFFWGNQKKKLVANEPFVTPIGVMQLTKEGFKNIKKFREIINTGDGAEAFYKGMREWFYILGFYLTLESLVEKGLLQMPYSKKEYKNLMTNSVAFMRMYMEAFWDYSPEDFKKAFGDGTCQEDPQTVTGAVENS